MNYLIDENTKYKTPAFFPLTYVILNNCMDFQS